MTMSDVRKFADAPTVAHAAAELVVECASAAIAARGRFVFGLSGGSTPKTLFALLATPEFAARIAWDRVFAIWGDERCVPPDHAQSNFRMAREALLDHVPLHGDHILRMEGEADPRLAAQRYENALRTLFPEQPWPRIDVLLLGLGDDGHTASLFPGTAALAERDRWVTANYVPQLEAWRLTLTIPAINAARQVVFLVAGASKSGTLRAVLHGPLQAEVLPAQAIQPSDGALTWLVDAAAAAAL